MLMFVLLHFNFYLIEKNIIVADGLSVEDFESTLAELQSFIDGDVFTALGGEDVAPGASVGIEVYIDVIRNNH